ncbi:MAG TPA: succinate dehydrogenase [Armatimonadota bacterium]|nr:succinate dehydrogenase [Armatimonadota bacterium]
MAVENAELPVVGSTPIPDMKRQDTWWVAPLITFIVFSLFIVYATYRTFENGDYSLLGIPGQPQYLSPFYSPTFGKGVTIFGFAISPALWIVPFPLLFRGTCYYYRKAYYRAFFWDPPACAVGEPAARHSYTGEREFPMTVQNLHRYFFYCAVVILAILWWDAFLAFHYIEPSGSEHFFVGVGSLIFLINVILLSCYTFGCHAWRHLVGGCVDCFSCSSTSKTRHGIWERVTHLNENHAVWAWASLISVALTDLYVREVVAGAWRDLHILG